MPTIRQVLAGHIVISLIFVRLLGATSVLTGYKGLVGCADAPTPA